MRMTKHSRSSLEGRHSQVFVGDLFAIEVVQKFGAIFVGIQDTHSTQMTVVEDGLPIRRNENWRVHVQRKHGWWFASAPEFVGVGARGCGGLVRARRDVGAKMATWNGSRKLAPKRTQKAFFFTGSRGYKYSQKNTYRVLFSRDLFLRFLLDENSWGSGHLPHLRFSDLLSRSHFLSAFYWNTGREMRQRTAAAHIHSSPWRIP